ncbi:MAG TPA: pilus assembly protein TadG-related protein [Bacillus sp. (in: firmicutes)]|uniref:pilus assembly protein TadG-related protein n=1 Tax=Bacillus litorisediminis TaxID=2922713 RepID=UPI001FAD870F|nr:pilus assembly protein TadG-related protein [Bacillus litorisediminis]HWO77052.1 pilus assembly protein TadG-related protein [Bacillus sp. (in: firmicutes)]
MNRLRELWENESGNVLVLVSLSLMALLAMTGLVIDGGMVYQTKSHLQKVANAAALSGAQELTNNQEKVEEVVYETLAKNDQSAVLKNLDITMEEKVAVDLEVPVSLAFSKLFGMDQVMVKAHAAAELRTMGRAAGAAPLGIDKSIPLEYYKEYELKVDQHDNDTGNFGVLALGGTGADTYEYNLRHGYQQEIRVGDILETQTGNIAGKTRTVVRERVNGCEENPRDVNVRECSRVILIPVYEPIDYQGNQLKQVRIVGFAYFYITDPMDENDTSIRGMFIERAGTGYEEPGALERGAFSIRLTE